MAENNQHFDIRELAEKWAQGKLSPEEKAYLEDWYAQFNDEQVNVTGGRHDNAEQLRSAMLAQLNALIDQNEKPIRKLWSWKRTAIAASLLIGLSTGAYFVLQQPPKVQLAQNDLLPGKNQATLTLANGQKIILTKTLNGKVAQQGNVAIQINTASGITYQGAGNQAIQYNTLSTSRGEIAPLPLILSDGTKVWLNTASSITYPVTFAANERKVTVTGEAYFEVVHNANKPFIVSANHQTIQDFGTAFDVNDYNDELTAKTTLVEGAIKVNQTFLKPGQQFQLSNAKVSVVNADVDEILAWKNGKFRFSNEKLSEIMLQASRWYNVDVVYDNDALKNKTFGVIGNRFAKASDLLHTLELTGEVKFKITANKITVTQP